MEALSRRHVVVGIIESMAVLLGRQCAKHGVVEKPFHAVAVAGLAGDPHKLARDLEVAVRPAWRFETRVTLGQALVQGFWTIGSDQRFVGAPSAGRKALLLE